MLRVDIVVKFETTTNLDAIKNVIETSLRGYQNHITKGSTANIASVKISESEPKVRFLGIFNSNHNTFEKAE